MDQPSTALEGIVADGSDRIGRAIVGDGFGYDDITAVAIGLSVMGDHGMAIHQVIVDAVGYKIVGPSHCRQQHQYAGNQQSVHHHSSHRLLHRFINCKVTANNWILGEKRASL